MFYEHSSIISNGLEYAYVISVVKYDIPVSYCQAGICGSFRVGLITNGVKQFGFLLFFAAINFLPFRQYNTSDLHQCVNYEVALVPPRNLHGKYMSFHYSDEQGDLQLRPSPFQSKGFYYSYSRVVYK
jgi:hypothetical protein